MWSYAFQCLPNEEATGYYGFSFWLSALLLQFLFPLLTSAMGANGYYDVFYVIAGMTFINDIILFIFMKEIKGKQKKEIEDSYDMRKIKERNLMKKNARKGIANEPVANTQEKPT